MTSSPSHPTGEKSAHEAVIRRYQKQIDYYWARGKGNKRRYITGRYLTIILGAAVTLLATLTSAEFIARSDTWDTILRIVTPLLAATLAVMVAGPRPAFDEVAPLLGTFGAKVLFLGEAAGLGQTMKLVNNALSITALAITSEAFVMGAKAGIDPETMLEVVNAGTGRNTATETKFPMAVLTRSFDYGATIDIIKKDMDLAVKEAERLGVPMWVGGAVRQLLYHVHARGAGGTWAAGGSGTSPAARPTTSGRSG